MADYLPKFKPGQAFTLKASAGVTGGRLVAVSGAGTVAHADADAANVIGVAGFDAVTGEVIRTVPEADIVETLIAEARRIADEQGLESGEATVLTP